MPARLARLNLDTSRPGFYDEPAFVAAERTDSTLLEAYAGFIDALSLDERYLEYARSRVRATATFLVDELKADGRKGACIDMSHAVSRFLERQGVWNYIVSGAVTVSFPRGTRLSPKQFWPIGSGPSTSGASAAHMWVRVPPFGVVDLTLAMQPYSNGEERFLPEIVISEASRGGSIELSDLLDPEAREELRRVLRREPELADIRLVNAGLLDRIERFGVWEHEHQSTRIRYVSCAVSAPDGPMDTAKNLRLRGRYMIDMWREFERRNAPPTGPRP